MTFDNAGLVSVFETTIRVLGGLLSAFELSRDRVRRRGCPPFIRRPVSSLAEGLLENREPPAATSSLVSCSANPNPNPRERSSLRGPPLRKGVSAVGSKVVFGPTGERERETDRDI